MGSLLPLQELRLWFWQPQWLSMAAHKFPMFPKKRLLLEHFYSPWFHGEWWHWLVGISYDFLRKMPMSPFQHPINSLQGCQLPVIDSYCVSTSQLHCNLPRAKIGLPGHNIMLGRQQWTTPKSPGGKNYSQMGGLSLCFTHITPVVVPHVSSQNPR